VLFGIVGYTALGGHKDTGQLGTQLFLGIIDVPETVGFSECGPVQTRRVSAKMRKLMERRAVVAGSIFECLLGWEMDAILSAIVEGPVGLVMYHLRPGPGASFLDPCHRQRTCAVRSAEDRTSQNSMCMPFSPWRT